MPVVWFGNFTPNLARFSRLTNGCAWNAVSAFASCGVPSHTSGQRCAKSRHLSRDGTFAVRVVTSSIDPCRSWVYNLRPKPPPWQLGQARLERLLYLLY